MNYLGMNYLDNKTRELHLWYPLEELKKEISMRTAYLGKLRRTEEAPHLLDLIHLTEDENNLLMSCANTAMADLYEPLSKYAREFFVPTMGLNDGADNSICVPNNMGVECDVFTDNNTLLVLPTKNPIDIDVTVTTKSHNSFDRQRYSVALFVEVTYTTGYQIKGVTSFTYIPDETSTQVIRINTTNVGGNDFQGKYKFAVPLKGETDTLTESYIISCQIKFHSVTLYAINAKDVPQFGWVEYDNKLYQTTEATDENDFLDTIIYQLEPNNKYILYPPIDPRYSIRYLLAYPRELNTQYLLPLDIAIKEALVCHIISHWLEYAYPDEVQHWSAKYDKALQDVYSRANMQAKPIVKLTPRWF